MKFNLDKLLKSHKVSQAKLAEELQVTQSSVNKYVLSKAEPSLENLCKIAEFFHISVDELLGRDTRLVNLASLDDNTREAVQAVLEMTPDEVDKLLNIIKIVKS